MIGRVSPTLECTKQDERFDSQGDLACGLASWLSLPIFPLAGPSLSNLDAKSLDCFRLWPLKLGNGMKRLKRGETMGDAAKSCGLSFGEGRPDSIITDFLPDATRLSFERLPHWTTISRSYGIGQAGHFFRALPRFPRFG